MTRGLMTLLLLPLVIGLTACGGDADRAVEATLPTASFTFDGSDDALEEVEADAEDHCDDRYDRDAELVRITRRQADSLATFRCI